MIIRFCTFDYEKEEKEDEAWYKTLSRLA